MLREKDKLLNRYEITKRIGRGRFATVWQAFDPQLEDTVAIKEISIDSGKEKDAKDAISEGRLLRMLNSTYVLSLWDIGIEKDCVYLIMEYADGGTLRGILEQRGSMPEPRVIKLMSQLCEGLAFAHDKGAIHRDLKPENLFFSGGIPKIGDFGLGKILRGSQRANTAGTGTPCYRAPEQYGKGYDKRADFWAMGMITLELLTGELPFDEDADEAQIMFQVIDPNQPIPVADLISPNMQEVLKKALAKNHNHRFQTALELQTALEDLSAPSRRERATVRTTKESQKTRSQKTRPQRVSNQYRLERVSAPLTEKVEQKQPKYRDKDGMKMVSIPAGTFMMGDETGDLNGTESWLKIPQHEVYTDAFYIDEHEVTNEQYCQFLNAGKPPGFEDSNVLYPSGDYLIWHAKDCCKIEKHGQRYSVKPGYENHPVVCVYWHGANKYAQWVGGRLPTEAEWEKAARGGLVGKKYPSGDSISKDDANYDDNYDGTTPVKSFAPNGYGLYDMAGNVYEWCSDYWDPDYYPKSPKNNPTASRSSRVILARVIRGGCCYQGDFWRKKSHHYSHVRCAFRHFTDDNLYNFSFVGFRVVVASGGL